MEFRPGENAMQMPDQVDFPIIREILTERDRGAAVVAGGFLEAKLTEVLRVSLRDDADTARQLLKPTGPLGSFGNKVLLGYMLRLYRKESRNDMILIGEIRNRFAHRPEPLTFGDAFVLERCQKLTLYGRVWSVIPDMDTKPPSDAASARKRYIETVSLAANFLHHQSKQERYREPSAENVWPF
jgi:hypothetical protein